MKKYRLKKDSGFSGKKGDVFVENYWEGKGKFLRNESDEKASRNINWLSTFDTNFNEWFEPIKMNPMNYKMINLKGNDIIKPFSICEVPVTQELYERVMGNNPSHFKGKEHPVDSVSWYDAVEYCNKLSKEVGLEPYYLIEGDNVTLKGGDGFRLPTEAEWEYAAKADSDFKYSGSNNLNEVGWYWNNSNKTTHPVKQKKPNKFGLFDMSGNVWEWCWDLFDNDNRVLRGGSWYDYGPCARVSSRNSYDPLYESYYDGFRIVRSLNT